MIATSDSVACGCCRSAAVSVAKPVGDLLADLRTLLGALDDPAYARPMGDLFQNATIGGHVRHCLDHVRAVVAGRGGTLDYDARARGTAVEASVEAAAAEVDRLAAAISELAEASADEPVRVKVMLRRDGVGGTFGSTLGRELAFVLSHTIHHFATIRGMAAALGVGVSCSFGFAPSTLAHQDARPCAR
ncbi:MAG: DinB family protein [Phycisphaerales bacterium]|nr:DinB family protein [Phycisphaerales bacterium]